MDKDERIAAINQKYFGDGRPLPKRAPKRAHLLFVAIGAELDGALKLRAKLEGKTVAHIVRRILLEGLK